MNFSQNKINIWSGFRYKWNKHPHRLNVLKLGFFDDRDVPSFYANVGNWPDENAPWHQLFSSVYGNGIHKIILKADIHLDCTYASAELQETTFRLRPGPLPAEKKWTALIHSLEISPVNNQAGWHFGGWKTEVVLLNPESHQSEVLITLGARPTFAPEPFSHGNKNWTNYPACQYQVKLGIQLLGIPADEGDWIYQSWKGGPVDGSGDFEAVNKDIPAGVAFSGISGFSFLLHAAKQGARHKGRYLRGWGIETHPKEGNKIYFSNKGLITWPWKLQYELKTAGVPSIKSIDFIFTGGAYGTRLKGT